MSITRPGLMTEPFANSGNKNSIPIEPPTDPNKINYASYSDGFPAVTMTPVEAGGKPPEGRDINGILYETTSHTVFQNAGGQYHFDADFAAAIGGYSKGFVLQSNDGTSAYYSVVDNNTTDFNADPTSIGSLWLPWAGDAVSGVPVSTVEYFAMSTPPPGYLKADGAAVGRLTYPELFAAIGTTFGAGDGSTTFNLPNLIGRHAKGSLNVGEYIEPGLPNVIGSMSGLALYRVGEGATSGAIVANKVSAANVYGTSQTAWDSLGINASRSNPIYGASDTVDVAAVGLLPCIKAFDAATNPGLIDITALANEIAGKVDRYIDNKPVRYVIDTYNDSTNWYRKWSDGWVEQGGYVTNMAGGVKVNLLIAMSNNMYFRSAISREAGDNANIVSYATTSTNTVLHLNAIMPNNTWSPATIIWEVRGQGAQQ